MLMDNWQPLLLGSGADSLCILLCHAVQWVTHAFCHANWQHLSMNLFNLCVFGKVCEAVLGGTWGFGSQQLHRACQRPKRQLSLPWQGLA